jgi:DNA-binding Lrp family transcriptional regulator
VIAIVYRLIYYSSMTDRNAQIVQMRQEGAPFAVIAQRFGISAERARAIILRAEEKKRTNQMGLSTRVFNAFHYGIRPEDTEYTPQAVADWFFSKPRHTHLGRKSINELFEFFERHGIVERNDKRRMEYINECHRL